MLVIAIGADSLVKKANMSPSSNPGPAAVSQRSPECAVETALKAPCPQQAPQHYCRAPFGYSCHLFQSQREKGVGCQGTGHNHCSFSFISRAATLLFFQSLGSIQQRPVFLSVWVVLYRCLCSLLFQGCVIRPHNTPKFPVPTVISPSDKRHCAPRNHSVHMGSFKVRISCGR